MSLADFTTQEVGQEKTCRLFNCETEERYGEPIVHLFGRDAEGEYLHVEVSGHNPSLLIREEDYSHRLDAHFAVDRCEAGYKDVFGNPLVRVYTHLPSNIPEIRDMFAPHTYEADVWFQNRFLIDKEIYTGFRVDLSNAKELGEGKYAVRTDAVRAATAPSVEPRIVTVDIEVAADYGFPHPNKAEWPVVSIVAHDSYTDETRSWLLESPAWDETPMTKAIVMNDERFLLNQFFAWVSDKRPDILTGWYSNGFDWPYLIKRGKDMNIATVYDLSPTGDVWVSRRWGDPACKGVTFLDMLDGYEKFQIHKLKDTKLETIAEYELGQGKEDIESLPNAPADPGRVYKWAWENYPKEFIDYNIRDVQAVIEINEAKNITETFERMRDVTGALLGSMIGNNITMIDILMLRRAKDAGICLPTAVKPEEDWYFGAYVFTPKAGLHRHVVYPDQASLYPNMMAQINMSPETLIGTRVDLMLSEWSESDCVWSYIDTRDVYRAEKGEDISHLKDGTYKAIMKNGKNGWSTVWKDDPQPVKCYFLKPEIKQGFVSGVVDELLDMKYEYKPLGKIVYESVKRVVNSVYGVFGDSKSFGRGFRLFNWMIAESITLGGRMMIQHSAETFVDYIGGEAEIVGGDTDSVMTAIGHAQDGREAMEIAVEAAQYVNDTYPDFCQEHFGSSEHRMELEVESYSPRCFFIQDEKKEEGVAKKKRYVTEITMDDKGMKDEPYMNIKGFEAVRSDQSQVTIDAQKAVFDILMHADPADMEEQARSYVASQMAQIRSGDVSLDRLGIPFGLSKNLTEYGSDAVTPMPQYRGAKYANQHIYRDERISKRMDGKPMYYYVSDVGSLPNHYSATTKEDGAEVDAISLASGDDMPDEVTVNYEVMCEKTLTSKVKPIFDTMGWSMP